MDRSGPTNLKRSRGERVSWGGEAEVKSTGTVPLLRRRHKVNTSAQPSGLRGTHETAEPTLSRSLSSGAALSSLGSAGNGCFTHKRRKEHRHRVAPSRDVQGPRPSFRNRLAKTFARERQKRAFIGGRAQNVYLRRNAKQTTVSPSVRCRFAERRKRRVELFVRSGGEAFPPPLRIIGGKIETGNGKHLK